MHPTVQFLSFETSEDTDGTVVLEAMAATGPERHAAVLAEARQVLDWAWQHFADSHGRLDEGGDWDHDLQVTTEDGGWRVVTLTLAASPRFAEAFQATFGLAGD